VGRSAVFHFATASLAPAAFEGLQAETVFADRNQLAHQQAHHAVEKSTGLDLDADQVSLAVNAHVLHGGASVGTAAAGSHESTEIVQSQEPLQG